MTSSSTRMTLSTSSTETEADAINGAPNITITLGCLIQQKSNSSMSMSHDSHEAEDQVHVFINVYVLTLLFCVSIPANVINMLVFWRQGLKERINLCLFALAVTDFITMSYYFCFYLDDIVAEYNPMAALPKMFKRFIFSNFLFVMAAFGYVSWFLCLVIAVERCVCVVFPLRASSLISTRTTLIMIITVTVVIVGCFAVVASRLRIVCMVDPASGADTDTVLPSQFYLDNKKLVDWMEGVGFGLILPGVCLFGVTTATTITIRQLRAVSRWRGLAMSGNATKSSSTPAISIVNASTTATASLTAPVSSSATPKSLKHTSGSSGKTSSTSVNISAKFGEASSTSVTTSASSVSARELALTRMLIALSVFFIVLTTPLFVVRAVVLIVPEVRVGGTSHNLQMTLIRIGNLSFYLNATVNFFVYCITGSRFRKTLCAFFPCCGSAAPKSLNSRSAASKSQQNMTTVSEM